MRGNNRQMPQGYVVRDGTLYIDDVKPDSAGEYICVGINNAGQVVFTAKANLVVIGKDMRTLKVNRNRPKMPLAARISGVVK